MLVFRSKRLTLKQGETWMLVRMSGLMFMVLTLPQVGRTFPFLPTAAASL